MQFFRPTATLSAPELDSPGTEPGSNVWEVPPCESCWTNCVHFFSDVFYRKFHVFRLAACRPAESETLAVDCSQANELGIISGKADPVELDSSLTS